MLYYKRFAQSRARREGHFKVTWWHKSDEWFKIGDNFLIHLEPFRRWSWVTDYFYDSTDEDLTTQTVLSDLWSTLEVSKFVVVVVVSFFYSVLPAWKFPSEPLFLGVCSTMLLKTLCEKEKLLVKSNFSFSTLFDSLPPFSSKLELSSANSFSLEESKLCRLGKG